MVLKVRLLEQKQLNIDTNILHQAGLEFDVDSKNLIKNYKFGLLLKFGTPCILMNHLGIKQCKYLQNSYLVFFS